MSKNTQQKAGLHFERDEIIGIFVSIMVAILFFAVLRFDLFHSLFGKKEVSTDADAHKTPSSAVLLDSTKDMNELVRVLSGAISNRGVISKLIIEDSKIGEGAEAKEGSRVKVQYVGMLQDGTQFDNSYSRGEPFAFTVGAGTVIKGWDQGVVGMKVGGQRILIIPGELAYGNRAIGPIPANATLLFAVELVSIE